MSRKPYDQQSPLSRMLLCVMRARRHHHSNGSQRRRPRSGVWFPLDDPSQSGFDRERCAPEDFLLTRRPVTKLQFVGTLVSGTAILGFSVAVFFLFVWPAAHSLRFINVVAIAVGSLMCILLASLGVKMIRRGFVGRQR